VTTESTNFVSKHAELLNTLDHMQGVMIYAARRDVLAQAERTIVSQEEEIARLTKQLNDLKAGTNHAANSNQNVEEVQTVCETQRDICPGEQGGHTSPIGSPAPHQHRHS